MFIVIFILTIYVLCLFGVGRRPHLHHLWVLQHFLPHRELLNLGARAGGGWCLPHVVLLDRDRVVCLHHPCACAENQVDNCIRYRGK
jgi:hypothetical protein